MYTDQRFTDMLIVVDGVQFRVHKLILAAQSPFFEAMFYNQSMVESTTDSVQLKETDAEIFSLLLKVIYSGCLRSVEQLDADTLVRLYILLERYQFVKFENSLLREIAGKYLRQENFWHFLDVAIYYNVNPFIDLCFKYFDLSGKASKTDSTSTIFDQSFLFSLEDFAKISHDTLKTLLDRNLDCSELLLLRATQKWIEYNQNSITNNEKWLLYKRIRLNLIPEDDLMNSIKVSDIDFSDLSEALELIRSRYGNILEFYLLTSYGVSKKSLNFQELVKKARQSILKNRALCISNYNICKEEFGFYMNNFDFIDNTEVDLLGIEKPVEIIINLGFPFLLNYIDMVLSDMKGDKFSYLIEYSVDGFNWIVLYDYRKYLCSNHQTLFFNQIVSRYFRIKGFHQNRMDNRTRRAFKSIKSFKALYEECNATIDVRMTDGILHAAYYSCQIKHRVYCDMTTNSPLGERYYCQRGVKEDTTSESYFKPIFILLDQPIMQNSFTFKLYDNDSRSYSYSVDIFDQHKIIWDCVADRSTEPCSGWQNIVFSSRPVNLIRITGHKIFNSTCNEFRIVKFNFSF